MDLNITKSVTPTKTANLRLSAGIIRNSDIKYNALTYLFQFMK
jgi:hypothetical protein